MVLPALVVLGLVLGVIMRDLHDQIATAGSATAKRAGELVAFGFFLGGGILGRFGMRRASAPRKGDGDTEPDTPTGVFGVMSFVTFVFCVVALVIAVIGPTAPAALGKVGVLLIDLAQGWAGLAIAAIGIGTLIAYVRSTFALAKRSSFWSGIVCAAGLMLPAAIGITGALATLLAIGAEAAGPILAAAASETAPPAPVACALGAALEPPWTQEAAPASPVLLGVAGGGRTTADSPTPARCMELLAEPSEPPPPHGKVAQAIRSLTERVRRPLAEDAVHTALVNVCTRRPDLAADPDRLYRYFWKSAVNRACSEARHPLTKACDFSEMVTPPRCPRPDPSEQAASTESDAIVRHALCQLTDQQRRILELYVEEEQSLSELGQAIGCSKSEAKRRLDGALDAVRSSVEARCR